MENLAHSFDVHRFVCKKNDKISKQKAKNLLAE